MNVCQHEQQRRAIEMCTDNCKALASKLEIDRPIAWSKEVREMQVQTELNLSFKNVS